MSDGTLRETDTGQRAAVPAPRSARPVIRRWLAINALERWAIVGLWIVLALVFSLVEQDRFATSATFKTIFGSQVALVFLAMSVLCTVMVGEFVDLSVTAVLGLSATLVPVLNVLYHQNITLSCIIAVAVGIAVGAVNGFLVVYIGVNTIVVTLGMSTLLLGIALWVSQLNTISGLGSQFSEIALKQVWGLPVSFYYGVALVLVFVYVVSFTSLGQHMRFVEVNRNVSRLAGIRVNRIRFGGFVVAGGIAAVGGIALVASLGGYDPNTSSSYLLPTYAAVFLGTAVVKPGFFNPIGTLIGVYFLETGVIGLEELGLNAWITDVFYGGVLIVAVAVSTLIGRRRK